MQLLGAALADGPPHGAGQDHQTPLLHVRPSCAKVITVGRPKSPGVRPTGAVNGWA